LFQGFYNRTVDAQGNINQALHQLDGFCQNVGLVGQWNACVDVQHMGSRGSLCQRVCRDRLEIVFLHFRCQFFAAGWIDTFPDYGEGAVKPDNVGFGLGFENSPGH